MNPSHVIEWQAPDWTIDFGWRGSIRPHQTARTLCHGPDSFDFWRHVLRAGGAKILSMHQVFGEALIPVEEGELDG